MAIHLVEGQTFAADYLLLHKLQGSSAWLAIYEPTHERVRLSLLDSSASTAEIQQDVDRLQPPVHPNLLRTHRVAEFEGQTFVVSEYKKGLATLNLSLGFAEVWPNLKSIINAVQYAHSLGAYHGRITPQCLMIDGEGTAYLDGFGLPTEKTSTDYLAPEAKTHPSASSDCYGIAQILYALLTGEVWSEHTSHDSSLRYNNGLLDNDVQHLLLAMLARQPNDRPDDFSSLIKLLEESGNRTQAPLSPTHFERAATPTVTATSPAGTRPAHTSPRDRNAISMPIVLMGLGLLFIVAVGLFLLLPDATVTKPVAPQVTAVSKPSESTQPRTDAEKKAPIELAPLELARLEELRKQGRNQAAELLRLQVAVEDVGGKLWAGDRYDQSTELGIQGDVAYREEQLQIAVDLYSQGINLLLDVLAETEQVFLDNLNLGINALEVGDYETAITAYQIVTRIQPTDAELVAGLVRATNLQQVLRLTTEAGVMERNGNLQAALVAFKEAAGLDALWQPARDGVNRINNRLARVRFQDQMSAGFNLLASDDFDGATAAFEQAQRILPGSQEPLDGMQQIELARTQKTIKALLAEAEALEAASRWADAIPIFEQILNISPGLNSAILGLSRVSDRATLKESLDKYLAQPHLMQNDDELALARTALLEASRLGLDSFKPAIRDLSHLISLARIKIDVVLKSDNRTDVTVYKVRQYGKLAEARLSLIPGVYTFVGKRPGYRDVYQEVNIKGDVSLVQVDISCTEKI